jgi:hypothetical protein
VAVRVGAATGAASVIRLQSRVWTAQTRSSPVCNLCAWPGAQRVDYTSRFHQTSLTLFTDYEQPPLIDGVSVDYAPKQVYDSPFIQSEFVSGVVRIQKGNQSVVLDFNE